MSDLTNTAAPSRPSENLRWHPEHTHDNELLQLCRLLLQQLVPACKENDNPLHFVQRVFISPSSIFTDLTRPSMALSVAFTAIELTIRPAVGVS